RRCSPGHRVSQIDELVIGGSIGGKLRIQSWDNRLNCGLCALEVVFLALAGGDGPQTHMNARDLSLHAGKLLHLVERQNYCTRFQSCPAMVDACNSKCG